MYYTACSLKLYININFSSKVDTEKFGISVSTQNFLLYLNIRLLLYK